MSEAQEPKPTDTKEVQENSQAAAEKTPDQIEAETKAKEEKKAAKDAKKAAAKAEKEAKKQARLDAQKKEQEDKAKYVHDPNDPCASKFGDLPICRSQCDPELRFTRHYVAVKDIGVEHEGKEVRIRGRMHNTRATNKSAFCVIREGYATIQTLMFAGDDISKGMCKYAGSIPKESIMEVVAMVAKPDQEIKTCTQQMELHIKEIFCVNKSVPVLPFQLEDASRQVLDQASETAGAKVEETKDGETKMPVVGQEVRLDNRIIDLRVPTNQAIFRIQAGICALFREFLSSKDFVEIHTPKLIGGASEGGSNVFKFKYFEQDACLAQSPQLYKQMALAGDLQRVFEIGPVFRAENSNTNRHLCEFTGLDLEMEFKNHYFEVLDMISELMVFMFTQLPKRYARELGVVNDQYPFEDFKCADPIVKLNFKEGIKLLNEAGIKQDPLDDLSTETEKALGAIVREKYDTDFYMLYGYPAAARPFYTMLDPTDNRYTNSYDFFMRGEEITSGAQRIHDPEMLIERAKEFEIPLDTIKDYINAFKYGVSPHGGAGFGMERVVKFYCNLHNIRKASLFPRDPKRLAP